MPFGFHFTVQLREMAAQIIAQRIAPLTLLNIFLYIGLMYGATQTPKQNEWSWWIGTGLVGVSFALAFLCFNRKKFGTNKVWRRLLYFLILIVAVIWGAVGATTQYYIALGWTSFFVMLMQLFVSASHLTVLVPNVILQIAFQCLLLLPSAYINLVMVKGFQGYAIASFLVGYAAIIISTGWIQFSQYWKNARNNERLQAMFKSMPGTLAWIDSKKEISQMNPEQEELFAEDAGHKDIFKNFTERVFASDGKKVSGLVEFAAKKFILSGKPYKFNNEAIILGVDVTDQHVIQEQLEFQRSQSQNSARWATLGEVVSDIVADLPKKIEGNTEAIEAAWPLLHKLTLGQIHQKEGWFSIRDCIAAGELFYNAKAKAEGVEFKVIYQGGDLCVDGVASDIMLAVFSLVNNAFDAVEGSDDKNVTIHLKVEGKTADLLVSDSGSGIDDYLKEVIFEPNFTTKDAKESTGLGLSLAKQLVDSHGGTLSVCNEKETVFKVHLEGRPLAKGSPGCG